MPAYSFKNVIATITGPGPLGVVTIPLSGGVGAAKEGIKIADAEDRNTMTIGADGGVQHSLKAGDGAGCEVNLQHTSAINFALMELYNYQKTNSAFWGQNVINVVDFARGDFHTLRECAFKKAPDEGYSDEAGNRTWPFDVGVRDSRVGPGRPEL